MEDTYKTPSRLNYWTYLKSLNIYYAIFLSCFMVYCIVAVIGFSISVYYIALSIDHPYNTYPFYKFLNKWNALIMFGGITIQLGNLFLSQWAGIRALRKMGDEIIKDQSDAHDEFIKLTGVDND